MHYSGHQRGTSTPVIPDDTKLSAHFRASEFGCNDGTPIALVHPALLNLLEDIRAHFGGKPITINSGFRTGCYNEKEKGTPSSLHLHGMAADIVVRGVSPDEVADYAASIHVGGVGRYSTFTHVDVFGKGRRWNG